MNMLNYLKYLQRLRKRKTEIGKICWFTVT